MLRDRGVGPALLLAVVLSIGLAALQHVAPARAESPVPTAAVPASTLSLTVEPMLGGVFAPGSWFALRVDLANDGPAVDGELRVTSASNNASTYSVPIELASGARQQHFLYGETVVFGGRYDVEVRSGATLVASAKAQIKSPETNELRAYVVAAHPELLTEPVATAISARHGPTPDVVAITPEELPQRAEAWSSVDLLVWHDIDSTRLNTEQVEALRTWLVTGGHLLILAGSSGATSLTAFPDELLPYTPTTVVDVQPNELAADLGTVPPEAQPLPALGGTLERGVALWRSGTVTIAARSAVGLGTVTMIGIDPTTAWLAPSPAAAVLWQDAVPINVATPQMQLPADDSFLVSALGSLPSVKLPSSDFLLLLILAYIVAIGPLNYLILKRRDRREWAWLTMPLTIGVFAVGAYGVGVLGKGSSVIVNELAIVQGAAGSERGIADVHVGVFSPARTAFNVKVGRAALISAPAPSQNGPREAVVRPLDVVLGDPATLRDYDVSFGAMRVFRAHASVDTPRVDADLKLAGAGVEGTIVNSSGLTLTDVSVVYGNGAQLIGDMAPGTSRTVAVRQVGDVTFEGEIPLAEALFPHNFDDPSSETRTVATRRAAIQHLSGGWADGMPGAPVNFFGSDPVILAWVSQDELDVDPGTSVQHVGETLFVLPARVAIKGDVVFSGSLIEQSVVSVDATDSSTQGPVLQMSHGTMSIDYGPPHVDGTLHVTKVRVSMDGADKEGLAGPGTAAQGPPLAPLPADQQPDSNAPLATTPSGDDTTRGTPALQLFDRLANRWVEFEALTPGSTYTVQDVARYIDATGTISARFVARGTAYKAFTFGVQIEGTVE